MRASVFISAEQGTGGPPCGVLVRVNIEMPSELGKYYKNRESLGKPAALP